MKDTLVKTTQHESLPQQFGVVEQHTEDLLNLFVTNKLPPSTYCDVTTRLSDQDSYHDSDYESDDDSHQLLHSLLSAGYTDCMEEAIRFLVEEENFAEEHPVLQGLKSHLERSRTEYLESVVDSVRWQESLASATVSERNTNS